jgi:hypothetical protein
MHKVLLGGAASGAEEEVVAVATPAMAEAAILRRLQIAPIKEEQREKGRRLGPCLSPWQIWWRKRSMQSGRRFARPTLVWCVIFFFFVL